MTAQNISEPALPDFFRANLALLRANHPETYAAVSRDEPFIATKVITAASGLVNLYALNSDGKWIALHPENNPQQDNAIFLMALPENFRGTVILMGLGLGYHALSLLAKRPGIRHIVIFEADREIFRRALHHVNLRPLLDSPKVSLCVGLEIDAAKQLSRFSHALTLEDTRSLNHPESLKLHPEVYQKLTDETFDIVNRLNIEGNTLKIFGPITTANRIRHLSSMGHDYLLEDLRGVFQNVPAIVVAGGPSLDKNIHLLPDAKNKAVIFAVDTVLPALLSQKIVPDFLTAIDGQKIAYEKIAASAADPAVQNISLICSSWVTPRVTKTFPAANIFWTFTDHHIEQWLKEMVGGESVIPGSSTVAHLNVIVASMLGCSPIIYMGQDLALSDSAFHCRHTVLTSENPAGLNTGALVPVKGIDGKEILTTKVFYNMKQYFEQLMEKLPNTYINATEGGVHLEGSEAMPLQRALDLHVKNSIDIAGLIKQTLGAIRRQRPNTILSELQTAAEATATMLREIPKIQELAAEVRQKIGKLKNKRKAITSFAALPAEIRKKSKKIDTIGHAVDSNDKIWKILQYNTMTGRMVLDRMKQDATELAGKPDRFLDLLSKNLEIVETLNTIRTETLEAFSQNISHVVDHNCAESVLLEKITGNTKEDQKLQLELIRLYMDGGNYNLASPFVKRLAEEELTAELAYFSGVIALRREDHSSAETHFVRAIALDATYQSRINTSRQQLADEYIEMAQTFQESNPALSEKLLRKALLCCPDSHSVRQSIASLARHVLQKISTDQGYQTTGALLTRWHTAIEARDAFSAALPEEVQLDFIFHHSRRLTQDQKPGQAEKLLRKWLDCHPDSSDFHVALAEALFGLADFDQGLQHLRTAVSLDRSHAVHWETLGDDLQKTNQHQEALYAYEQSYVALPEHFWLLKKMGDSYLALEQLEAAREAYLHYKNMLAA